MAVTMGGGDDEHNTHRVHLGQPATQQNEQQRQRGRKPLKPNSILDRPAFERALQEAGLDIAPLSLTALYQNLHRQHYPDLETFVRNYHENQHEVWMKRGKVGYMKATSDSTSKTDESPKHKPNSQQQLPLKNAVSTRKNRNKAQLPSKLLEFLTNAARNGSWATLTSHVALEKTSGDGSTTKLAVQLQDGKRVESVLMRYVTVGGSRASLCVSSQCGCAMQCTFCATGTMGWSGNLSTGEILEQIVHADHILAREWQERQQLKEDEAKEKSKILLPKNAKTPTKDLKLDLVRNVVFMGMGEPLDNYNNVVEACRALLDRKRWNLAHGRVTVSTVGIVSKMRKLTVDLPQVSLALSLHAPNQELRQKIVPTAKRYPIEDLIDALDEHMKAYILQRRQQRQIAAAAGQGQEEEKKSSEAENDDNGRNPGKIVSAEALEGGDDDAGSSRRRAMIEYVMLEGPTSSFECAHQLGRLCQGRSLVVNLIPYNNTDVPEDKLSCPSHEHLMEFKAIVGSYGVYTTIRRTMGADIDSACGQLITNTTFTKKGQQSQTSKKSTEIVDIEEVGQTGCNSKTLGSKAQKVTRSKRNLAGEMRTARERQAKLTTTNDAATGWDSWIVPLTVATAIAATLFLVSTCVYVRQSSRRR